MPAATPKDPAPAGPSRRPGRRRRRLVQLLGVAAAAALAATLVAAAGTSAQAGARPGAARDQATVEKTTKPKPRTTTTKKSKKKTKKTKRTTPTTSTRKKYTCTTAPSQLRRTTADSLVFSLSRSDLCIYPGPSSFTVSVYASATDAEAGADPVGTNSGPAGKEVVVGGLQPGTDYWYVTSDLPWVRGPARTQPVVTPTLPPTSSSPVVTRTCVPMATHLSALGATWATFTPAPCTLAGQAETWSVRLFLTRDDAQAGTAAVAEASGPLGPLTVTGLTPGGVYWVKDARTGALFTICTQLAPPTSTTAAA